MHCVYYNRGSGVLTAANVTALAAANPNIGVNTYYSAVFSLTLEMINKFYKALRAGEQHHCYGDH